MIVPNRSASSSSYRYGFQGQEKDDEIRGGEGNSINYTFRMHDPRIGRFFAVDPLEPDYPFYSPYQFSGNRVIDMIELEGLEPTDTKDKKETPSPGFPGSDKPIELEEVVIPAKVKSPTAISDNRFAKMSASLASVNRGIQWEANGNSYRQVSSNTLFVQPVGYNPKVNMEGQMGGEYQLILPQSYGDWNTEGSDGLRWIGCMSCHAPNGAYAYAVNSSIERRAGIVGSMLLDFGFNKIMKGAGPAFVLAEESMILSAVEKQAIRKVSGFSRSRIVNNVGIIDRFGFFTKTSGSEINLIKNAFKRNGATSIKIYTNSANKEMKLLLNSRAKSGKGIFGLSIKKRIGPGYILEGEL
jgi:RHS repeat-associated protein